MHKRIFSFKEFIFEQENKEKDKEKGDSTGIGFDLSAGGMGAALAQQALSKLGFVDKDYSKIADTKETKGGLPYTACGSTPYQISPVDKTNKWIIDLFVYPEGQLSKKDEYIEISKELTGSSYNSGATGATGATGGTPVASAKVKESLNEAGVTGATGPQTSKGATGATGATGTPSGSTGSSKPYAGSNKIFILGIREKLDIKKREGDKFVDKLLIIDPSKLDQIPETFAITTTPSVSYYGNPARALNPNGTAIMQPGVYRYKIGIHKKGSPTEHEALIQDGPMEIQRYKPGSTEVGTYEPGNEDKSDEYGINIHRGSKGPGVCVGPYSAGCQVFANGDDFNRFMTTIKGASQNGGKFLYVLLENDTLSDIEKENADNLAAKKSEEEEKVKADEEKSKEKKKRIKDQKQSEKMDEVSDEIRKELDAFNSDEDKLIDLYNSIVNSEESAKAFKKFYKQKYDVDIIDDLDRALDNSELKKLSFKSSGGGKSGDDEA